MAHHSSSPRPTSAYSFNTSNTHPASYTSALAPFTPHRPHVTLAPSSVGGKGPKNPIPTEGVISGGGGGGGVGAGSGDAMGDAPSVEDAGGSSGSSGRGMKGGEMGRTGGGEGQKDGGKEDDGGEGGYGDVRRYHPAWEGFGRGSREEGTRGAKAKL